MNIKNNKIFITGGTSGIGLALAKEFLKYENNIVIVCGRDEKKLQKIKHQNPKLHTIKCDVTKKQNIKKAHQRIQKKFGNINLLINNAGVQFLDNILEEEHLTKKAEITTKTDFLAIINLIKEFLPDIKKTKNSAIVNMSSAVAYMPIPKVAVYSAVKSAISSYSQSLRFQLRKTNIQVFTIYPPKVNTKLNKFSKGKGISPKKMAQEIIIGLQKNKHEIRTGNAKLLYFGARFFPRISKKIMQNF